MSYLDNFIYRFNKSDFIKVNSFLNEAECNKILQLLNQEHFHSAHQLQQGRNNQELFTKNPEIILIIKNKLLNFKCRNRKVISISEHFEFYRYDIGNFITPHTDASILLDNKYYSNYTGIIYLNDDFKGGETLMTDQRVTIKPEMGQLLLFDQKLKHEALMVTSGTKFIYRTNCALTKK